MHYEEEGKANVAITIIVFALIVSLGLGYYLLSKGPVDPVRILDVSHTPQNPQPGDTITLTAKVEGVSGPTVYVYNSYFGTSPPSGAATFWGSMGGGEYSTEVYVTPENGEEVSCFIIAWDDDGNPTLSDEHVIQIGHVERSNITSLEISNVSHGTPPNPDTSTPVKVYADIQSDATPINAEVITLHYGKNKSYDMGGNAEMSLQTENTYEAEVSPSHFEEDWPSGITVMYKIVAKDNAGNTAVSEWDNFVIS